MSIYTVSSRKVIWFYSLDLYQGFLHDLELEIMLMNIYTVSYTVSSRKVIWFYFPGFSSWPWPWDNVNQYIYSK